MKTALGLMVAAGCLVACGPPELTVVPDNPYSNDESAVVHAGKVTLVASRNEWYEQALSQVSTPVDLMIVNRSNRTLPVSLDDLVMTDEQGRTYRAMPAQTVVSRLFGASTPPPESYLEPVPVPPQQQPQEQQPPPQEPTPPPSGTQQPSSSGSPSQTLAPTLNPGIVLVAGHGGGGGHAGGGHAVGGARGGALVGPRGGRGFYGPRGYFGFRGRFGYGYGWGWGVPYWGWGGWGWGFGPAYVVGLDTDDYYYPGYDPREFDHLGPWQVYQAALRPTDLKPNQRMGGLVFFEPAWNARYLTLKFTSHPEGEAPVVMQARFEVTR